MQSPGAPVMRPLTSAANPAEPSCAVSTNSTPPLRIASISGSTLPLGIPKPRAIPFAFSVTTIRSALFMGFGIGHQGKVTVAAIGERATAEAASSVDSLPLKGQGRGGDRPDYRMESSASWPPASDAEQLLERPAGRGDRLRVGALLRLVLRGGEAVAGTAVDLELEGHLGAAQLLHHLVDRRERIALVLGAVQDQEHALGVLRPAFFMIAERPVDRDIGRKRYPSPA